MSILADVETLETIGATVKRKKASMIREIGSVLEARLGELAAPLRKELEIRVREYQRIGTPPSLLRIMGQSHLEKPFNRILKWCADVEGKHGFGREFLRELASMAELPALEEDMAAGEIPEVAGETSIDHSGCMPDLLVRTSRAALMLENKVHAGESGNQYLPYLRCFQEWAGQRQSRALLCARNVRDRPIGWHGTIIHAQLANLFERLARLEAIPLWGRVTAWQCSVTFHDAEPDDTIAAAHCLLSSIAVDRITPGQFRQLRQLQGISSPKANWPT